MNRFLLPTATIVVAGSIIYLQYRYGPRISLSRPSHPPIDNGDQNPHSQVSGAMEERCRISFKPTDFAALKSLDPEHAGQGLPPVSNEQLPGKLEALGANAAAAADAVVANSQPNSESTNPTRSVLTQPTTYCALLAIVLLLILCYGAIKRIRRGSEASRAVSPQSDPLEDENLQLDPQSLPDEHTDSQVKDQETNEIGPLKKEKGRSRRRTRCFTRRPYEVALLSRKITQLSAQVSQLSSQIKQIKYEVKVSQMNQNIGQVNMEPSQIKEEIESQNAGEPDQENHDAVQNANELQPITEAADEEDSQTIEADEPRNLEQANRELMDTGMDTGHENISGSEHVRETDFAGGPPSEFDEYDDRIVDCPTCRERAKKFIQKKLRDDDVVTYPGQWERCTTARKPDVASLEEMTVFVNKLSEGIPDLYVERIGVLMQDQEDLIELFEEHAQTRGFRNALKKNCSTIAGPDTLRWEASQEITALFSLSALDLEASKEHFDDVLRNLKSVFVEKWQFAEQSLAELTREIKVLYSRYLEMGVFDTQSSRLKKLNELFERVQRITDIIDAPMRIVDIQGVVLQTCIITMKELEFLGSESDCDFDSECDCSECACDCSECRYNPFGCEPGCLDGVSDNFSETPPESPATKDSGTPDVLMEVAPH